MSCTVRNRLCAAIVFAAVASAAAQSPLGTAFIYQASLMDSNEPASGAFDFVFTLYNAGVGGAAVGSPVAANDWPVDVGLFAVPLDFGAGAFNGEARWLEIAVRPGASGGAYTPLTPRQPILATPYALFALNGGAGGELWQEGPSGGIYYDAGNVGIGTSTPSSRLTVVGTDNAVQVQTTGGGSAIVGTHSGGGNGVMGQSLAGGAGAYGLSNTGTGVLGQNTTSGALGALGHQQYAVYGLKPDGIAGYFDGDVRITGDLTVDGAFDAHAWSLTGNAGSDPNVNFVGTTDNQPLELRVNSARALRIEPGVGPVGESVNNIVAGYHGNQVAPGSIGATIAGGGYDGNFAAHNQVTGNFGTVGGGYKNAAAHSATVSGGAENSASHSAAIGGGRDNVADGAWSAVAGGETNFAGGNWATVGGGRENSTGAEYAAVGGGRANTAAGGYAVVPGGFENQAGGSYSFAAGRRAKVRDATEVGGGDVDGDEGTFVWADASDPNSYFASTGPNQFIVRATGGIDLNANASGGGLRLEPGGSSPNVIGGYAGNYVSPNVGGAVIAGGGGPSSQPPDELNRVTDPQGAIVGGYGNQAGDDDPAYTFAGPFVGGGGYNRSSSFCSVVTGGYKNTASSYYSSVGGGQENTANGQASAVPGGGFNQAGGSYSFAAGRRAKVRDATEVGGGDPDGDEGTFVWADSTEEDFVSTGPNQFLVRAGGGVGLFVDSSGSGGHLRLDPSSQLVPEPPPPYSPTFRGINVLGGSILNEITPGVAAATISGGGSNTFSVGNEGNRVTDLGGTVSGGVRNTAGNDAGNLHDAAFAVVAGGYSNTASDGSSTVSGGKSNHASGAASTIPGGLWNQAGGDYSFAAGRYAKVRDPNTSGDSNGDEGAFVWADTSSDDPNGFSSTGPNQFLIRAAGGVGINTNTPDPNSLTVNGVVRSLTGGFRFPDGVTISSGAAIGDITAVNAGSGLTGGGGSGTVTLSASFAGNGAATTISRSDHYHNALNASDGSPTNVVYADPNGNVGVGTTSPAHKLDVNGTLQVAGTGASSANLIIADTNGSNDRPGIQFTNNSMHYICGDDQSVETFGVYSVFGNNRTNDATLTIHGKATGNWGKYLALTHDGTDGRISTDDATGDLVLAPGSGKVGIGTADPSAKLHIGGTPGADGIKFPDGTLQTSASRGITAVSVSVDPPSLSAGGATSIAVTVTGAVAGDAVVANPGANLPDGYGITFVRVSGANTVAIGFINGTASSQNPSASTWQFRVIK